MHHPSQMVCFRVVHALVAIDRSLQPKKSYKHKVQNGSPNNPNPPRLGYGSYRIRAQADVMDKGVVVGAVNGYDSSPDIIKEVEGRCRSDIRYRGLECGKTSIVILTNMDAVVCEGVYFEIEGRRVRLV